MSITLQQGDLYVIPPGGSEVISLPFTLADGVSILSVDATKEQERGSTTGPIVLGTPTAANGTVSIQVTTVTEGQKWWVHVHVATSETPDQDFYSTFGVLVEYRR
jgi:hypothetical protein